MSIDEPINSEDFLIDRFPTPDVALSLGKDLAATEDQLAQVARGLGPMHREIRPNLFLTSSPRPPTLELRHFKPVPQTSVEYAYFDQVEEGVINKREYNRELYGIDSPYQLTLGGEHFDAKTRIKVAGLLAGRRLTNRSSLMAYIYVDPTTGESKKVVLLPEGFNDERMQVQKYTEDQLQDLARLPGIRGIIKGMDEEGNTTITNEGVRYLVSNLTDKDFKTAKTVLDYLIEQVQQPEPQAQ